MGRLDGKVAIITGGASGIGAASARLFAREGAKVAVCDLDPGGIDRIVAEISDGDGLASGSVVDVSNGVQVQAFIDEVVELYGRLDVLFANAGVPGRGTVVEIRDTDFYRTLAINLGGAFLSSKYAIPHLAASGGGSIIFTASELALVGSRRNAAYTASKAALIGLARSMALDHAPEGVRVNVLCPGPVDTPMLRRSIETHEDSPAYEQMILDENPMGRFGAPDEIARVALFLASDDSSYMTGSTIVVDGGVTAQ